VRNIPGRGCIFTVELPRLRLETVGTSDAAATAEVGATTGVTP
jgi:hypothetical protein